VHGRPLLSRLELIGALGAVMLQLFTTGLIGGGVAFGVALDGAWAGRFAGAAGFCFCRAPSTGANSPSAQKTVMAGKDRIFTVQISFRRNGNSSSA
jgi:hypothetical protein